MSSPKVFLSHNSQHKPQVEEIAKRLLAESIEVWLDEWNLVPGKEWQDAIEEALESSSCCVVFIGPGGLGTWQLEEMRRAIERRVKGEFRVIPVLMPGTDTPNLDELPSFLTATKCVDFRNSLDDEEAFRRLVSGIRGVEPGPGILTRLPIAAPEKNDLWNVPFPQLKFFTGRMAFLEQLHSVFTEQTNVVTAQAISGLGGIGKTQTAVEYAYRNRHAYEAVFWVGADTELDLTNGFINIADELGLPYDKTDVDSAISAVKRWLSNNTNWLFIFDNADDPNIIKPYQPTTVRGHVLLTSRASVFDMLGITKPVELPELTTREATDFLFRRTGRDDGNESERLAAEKLSEELEGLPLALEQAGAYIIRTRVSFCRYLENYEKHRIAMFKKYGPVTGEYTESVATTWLMNFEEVKQMSAASADLLRFSAFLSPDHIPFELITTAGEQLGPTLHEFISNADDTSLAVSEALEPLTRFSLVRLDAANESYSMHRLVQEVLKSRDET